VELRIRAARAEDVAEVFALERKVQEAPHWPLGAYMEMVEARPEAVRRCLLIAERMDKPGLVGFAVGRIVEAGDEPIAELESVVVAEEARREGIGRALCEAVLDWCRAEGASNVELEVRSLNSSALALYRRLGFVEEGRRKDYYRAPSDDAVLMRVVVER